MNKNIIKSIEIVCLVIIACLMMYLVETALQPAYFLKSVIKISVFSLSIFIYFRINKGASFQVLMIKNKKQLLIAILWGFLVYGIIISVYYFCQNIIDLKTISENLLTKEKISKENFIYVSMYISIVNSFLEEAFFRGFAFLELRKYLNQSLAYGFSALSFALYHISIMSSWFSIAVFLIIVFSLFFCGIFFDYLDKNSNIYNSWLVHLCANLGINTIGYMMFGLV